MQYVRLATIDDVSQIVVIHQANFIRQMHSKTWIHASISAHPRFLVYVLIQNHVMTGYVIWAQKSGFRQAVVLELDQIAILPTHQGQGLAKQLIQESLTDIKNTLQSQDRCIKAILVSTAKDNPAQMLYQKVLGVQTVATLTGLYNAPEIIMLKTFE